MHARHRLVGAALIVTAALAMTLPAPAASAATTTTAPATTSPATSASGPGVELVAGWFALSGTVTRPGTTTRHFNANQAAAFIQSWYPATIYGTIKEQTPPANLPVYTILIKDQINGGPYTFKAFYASDGHSVWAGLPPQVIGPGATVPKKVWFLAPARTILAFKGTLPAVPFIPATTTTTAAPANTSTPASSNSSSSTGWIVAVVVVVVVIGLGGLLLMRKRARTAP
jgi:hypothetical protein